MKLPFCGLNLDRFFYRRFLRFFYFNDRGVIMNTNNNDVENVEVNHAFTNVTGTLKFGRMIRLHPILDAVGEGVSDVHEDTYISGVRESLGSGSFITRPTGGE